VDVKQMIGRRIKEIRTSKAMTQEYLAEKMDISPKYLSSIERGKENPTLNTLISMSESLEVDLGEIFRFLEVEDPKKRKTLISELIKGASEDKMKVILKVLVAVLR
jgi:transcriptional regulator with XRE-family HTH domain